MTEALVPDAMRFELVTGPEVELAAVLPHSQIVLGRGRDCGIALLEESVSRRHASITHVGHRWMLTDLNSRMGTYLNAVRLTPNEPAALDDGDLITIGPWTLRAAIGRPRTVYTATLDDSTERSQRVERLHVNQTARLAQHRLELILECAAAITGSTDEKALAEAALRSALEGSGFHRGALIRQHALHDEVEVIGSRERMSGYRGGDGAREPFVFSRSLLREAAGGQVARLTEQPEVPLGASIAELNITAALCAPIKLGASIAAYLYLDARGGSAALADDAAGFCQVIARLCGMALVNIKRLELEERQRRLERELSAAREAQQLIVPQDHGEIGIIRYAIRMRPGRFVAGDLFDVIDLGESRVAVVIGDVSGEGVGAAMLMVAAQSHMHAALQQHGDLATAVNTVNAYIAPRCPQSKFISMWVGLFDLARGELQYIDAGHGHWLHKPSGDGSRPVRHSGGIPLGIDHDFAYQVEHMPISPGDRVILYSDGVIEQRSPFDEQFGRDRVIELVNGCSSAEQDVKSVLGAVERFAGRADLADDTTVASIEWTS